MLVIPTNTIRLKLFIDKLEDVEPNLVSIIKSFFILTKKNYKTFDEIFFNLFKDKYIEEPIKYLFFPLYKRDIFSNINNRFLSIIEFGQNITNLDNNLFKNCFFLKKIYFPQNNIIKFIGPGAFLNCYELTKIDSKINCHVIFSNTFKNCFKLKKVILGEKLKRIEKNSFINCLNLEEIFIPDSVFHMDNSSFVNCYIKKINIPSDFDEIKELLFENCYIDKYIAYSNHIAIISLYLLLCFLLALIVIF